IFSDGEIGNEMFIIQSGTVEILKQIGGETRILATLEKGDFFGEMSVLEDLPRIASARAKTDVELVRINGATFDTMIKSNTESARGARREVAHAGAPVRGGPRVAGGRPGAAGPETRAGGGAAPRAVSKTAGLDRRLPPDDCRRRHRVPPEPGGGHARRARRPR